MSVIVRNIISTVSKEDIRKLFKDCGEIKKINLTKNNKEVEAEIVFTNKQALKKAIEKNNSFYKNTFLSVVICEENNNRPKLRNNKNLIMEEEEEKESSEEVSEMEYSNFMKEYKQFIKSKNKNSLKSKKIIGENDVSSMLGDATNLYLASKYDEAINYLHEIIRLSPEIPEPYHHLSLIYEKKGEYSKALDFLMLSAQLSHGESDIWIRCSYLNRRLNNLQQAEYCITRALKIEKDNPYLLYERAVLHEEMGNIRKAAHIYERILKIIPNNSDILIYVSNLYLKLNNYEEAISILENFFEKSNKKYLVLVVLFNLYLMNNKYKEGIEFYEKMFFKTGEEDNVVPPIDLKLRYLFFKLLNNENHETSESNQEILQSICDEIETLDVNQHVDLVNKLYDILEKLNKFDKFSLIFEKFDDVDESNFNPEIFVKLGDLYNSKNVEKSIQYYLRAVKFYPSDISIRLKLSHLYKEISQFEKALEILVIKPEEHEFNDNFLKIEGNNIIIEKRIFEPNKEITIDDCKSNVELEKVKNSSPADEYQFNYEENENLLSDNNFTKEYLNIKIEDENINQQNPLNLEDNEEENSEERNIPKENISMILNKSPINDNLLDPEQYMDLYENRLLQETSHKSFKKKNTFLRKKRIKTSYSNYMNYNFENYLFKRNSKLLSKEAFSLTSIRLEFEEIINNLPKIKNTYIKLQESLIYLQSNNIEKFLETTFSPLKQTLINELKIEELKNRVFENFLAKSNIKNYFKKNTNILEENRSCVNETDERYENRDGTDGTDGALLFLRKTNSNNILHRKKVRKSMELAENQIKLIDNLYNFFPEKTFFSIVYNFIFLSYKAEKYNHSYQIIKLLLNTQKIRPSLNGLSFNLYILAVLNNIKLDNYRISFYYLKKIIISNNLKNSNIYWNHLWDIAKNLNYSFLRSYLYKLKLNKSLKNNNNLEIFLGNCYLRTGNYDLAEKSLTFECLPEHPLINLQLCLCHLYKSFSRKNKSKKDTLIKARFYFNKYCLERINENVFEMLFNSGRFFQFIGCDVQAFENYNKLISMIFKKLIETEEENDYLTLIKKSTIYNYAMMYKSTGNYLEAHDLLLDNIII